MVSRDWQKQILIIRVKRGFKCTLAVIGRKKIPNSYFQSTFAASVDAAKSSSGLQGRRQTAQTCSRGKKRQTWRKPGEEEWADFKDKLII